MEKRHQHVPAGIRRGPMVAATLALAVFLAGCTTDDAVRSSVGWQGVCSRDWVDSAEYSGSMHFWRYEAEADAVESCLRRSPGLATRTGTDGTTPLHMAAMNAKDPEILDILLSRGARVDAKTGTGETPLHWAAGARESYNFDPGILDHLVGNGADVGAEDGDGETPLHKAAFSKHPEIIEHLIRHGAGVDARNDNGDSPLHKAALGNHAGAIDVLVRHGAAVDARNNDGDTALLLAARESRKSGVSEALIRNGADIDALDANGATALQLASSRSGTRTVELRDAIAAHQEEVAHGGGNLRKALLALDARDYDTALGEILPMAERGDPVAQFALGAIYEDGRGIERSDADAASWYRRAAGRGHAEAQYNLAVMNADGRGVPADQQAAHVWFSIALENGIGEAGVAKSRIETRLSDDEIAEADQLARECVGSRYRNCP